MMMMFSVRNNNNHSNSNKSINPKNWKEVIDHRQHRPNVFLLVTEQQIIHGAGKQHHTRQIHGTGGQNSANCTDWNALLCIRQVAGTIRSSHDTFCWKMNVQSLFAIFGSTHINITHHHLYLFTFSLLFGVSVQYADLRFIWLGKKAYI